MATIILDAAHGGNNIGLLYGNRMEKTDNLKLALAVGKIFEENGIETIYIRKSDIYLSPLTRLQIANCNHGDIYLSFHRMSDCTPNSKPGMDFFLERDNGLSRIIAESINNQLRQVGFRSYGIKDNLSDYVLSNIKIPGICLNLGFIDSIKDNKLYDCNFDEIAEAIADGVMVVFKEMESLKLHNNDTIDYPYIDNKINNWYDIENQYSSRDNSLRVILDAGHGGNDCGVIYRNRKEKNDTLKLTLEIGRILRESGVTVIYTRAADQTVLPGDRIKIVNDEGGDILLSIHRMVGTTLRCHQDIETFINAKSEIGEAVARNICDNLYDVGYHNDGIYMDSEVTLLKETLLPAIMLLIGYINSNEDNKLFDEKFFDMAKAIANGILLTYGIGGENKIMRELPIENENNCHYHVQIGLFKNYTQAVNYQEIMTKKGYQAQISTQGKFYSVEVGDFTNLDEAAKLERILRLDEYHTLIVAK